MRVLSLVVALLLVPIACGAEPAITLVEGSDSLTVKADGKDIATYVFKHKELTRPCFIHVRSLQGTPVTRDFPPKSSDNDHDLLHPGFWLTFSDINGHDYWRQKARVEHERFVPDATADPKRSFTVRNKYLSTDGKSTICTEQTRFTFVPAKTGWWLIWEATFDSDQDLTFGMAEEMGLAVRITSPLRVTGGKGTIRNAKGEENGKGTWGKVTEWLDYSGPLGERSVGVFVASDPANGRDFWAHSRDYGLMALNPFARPGTGGKKFTLNKGEKLSLAFGLLIHDTPSKEPSDGKSSYEEFLKMRKKEK